MAKSVRWLVLFLVAAARLLPAQDAPKVVSLTPSHLASDVDAAATKQLVVTFDRAMDQNAWSLCGGGPKHPKVKARPVWQNPKTLVVDVELEPDHDYALSLNCPAGSGFKSQKGVVLAMVPWQFSTLPKELPKPAVQKPRNEKALAALTEALAASYSYYDLRVRDWPKLLKENRPALLAAKTDRAWASAAAQMLAPTADLHLYLRLGDQTFATGTRAVDPLFRRNLVEKQFTLQTIGDQVLYGRNKDGIGYLMVGEWDSAIDPERIGGAITELMDTRAMIVDARPNAGGDELLAQKVAAWFVAGTVVYGKNRYRVRAGKDGFGPVLTRSMTGNKDGKRYDRPIAVLTSRYVMSSNESFVMMLRQAGACTVVGQPTFGSSGNPKPHELGNGVTLVAPSWQDLRLDGTCFEGEGLQPDVVVACTSQDLETHDPILDKALELLGKKVAK